MKKLFVSVLALCAFTAVACGDNATRLGTAGPTSPVKMFGVSADPSVVDGGGQNAMVGSIAQLTTTGLQAWAKYGAADTAWQPFPSVAATSTTAGLMSAAQAATLANTAGGLAVAAYETAVVSLTATSTTAVSMPTVAGKVFVCTQTALVVVTRSAATLSGTLVYQLDQNGAAVSGSASVVAALSNTLTVPQRVGIGFTAAVTPDMTTFPLQIEITGAYAGATATGKFVVLGYYE